MFFLFEVNNKINFIQSLLLLFIFNKICFRRSLQKLP